MTFLNARSAPSSVLSASAFSAASRKRLYCAGSSGFWSDFLAIGDYIWKLSKSSRKRRKLITSTFNPPFDRPQPTMKVVYPRAVLLKSDNSCSDTIRAETQTSADLSSHSKPDSLASVHSLIRLAPIRIATAGKGVIALPRYPQTATIAAAYQPIANGAYGGTDTVRPLAFRLMSCFVSEATAASPAKRALRAGNVIHAKFFTVAVPKIELDQASGANEPRSHAGTRHKRLFSGSRKILRQY